MPRSASRRPSAGRTASRTASRTSQPASPIATIDSIRDLFVYGTLMDNSVQRQLIGRRVAGSPATLFGFRRVQNPDSYPYLLRSDHSRVRGQLLRGLTAEELQVLDAYEDEGQLYHRQLVTVRCGAVDVPAFTYIGIADALRTIRRSHFDDNRIDLSRHKRRRV